MQKSFKDPVQLTHFKEAKNSWSDRNTFFSFFFNCRRLPAAEFIVLWLRLLLFLAASFFLNISISWWCEMFLESGNGKGLGFQRSSSCRMTQARKKAKPRSRNVKKSYSARKKEGNCDCKPINSGISRKGLQLTEREIHSPQWPDLNFLRMQKKAGSRKIKTKKAIERELSSCPLFSSQR